MNIVLRALFAIIVSYLISFYGSKTAVTYLGKHIPERVKFSVVEMESFRGPIYSQMYLTQPINVPTTPCNWEEVASWGTNSFIVVWFDGMKPLLKAWNPDEKNPGIYKYAETYLKIPEFFFYIPQWEIWDPNQKGVLYVEYMVSPRAGIFIIIATFISLFLILVITNPLRRLWAFIIGDPDL